MRFRPKRFSIGTNFPKNNWCFFNIWDDFLWFRIIGNHLAGYRYPWLGIGILCWVLVSSAGYWYPCWVLVSSAGYWYPLLGIGILCWVYIYIYTYIYIYIYIKQRGTIKTTTTIIITVFLVAAASANISIF